MQAATNEPTWHIYKLTNTANGRVYFGSSPGAATGVRPATTVWRGRR